MRRVCADDASEVKCAEASDDRVMCSSRRTLEPGTYYAVVDGAGGSSEGPFTLRATLERAASRAAK